MSTSFPAYHLTKTSVQVNVYPSVNKAVFETYRTCTKMCKNTHAVVSLHFEHLTVPDRNSFPKAKFGTISTKASLQQYCTTPSNCIHFLMMESWLQNFVSTLSPPPWVVLTCACMQHVRHLRLSFHYAKYFNRVVEKLVKNRWAEVNF